MRACAYSFSVFAVTIYMLATNFISSDCFVFDKNYFGVTFRPYVKRFENGSFNYKSYTYEHVKTMLTISSGKFAKVLVKDTYAFEDEYIDNVTYHNGSFVSVYTGEVAANINRENGGKILTVLYQSQVSESVHETNAELQLVFEAAEKANRIFPGTVEGIILGKNFDSLRLQQTLNNLDSYKAKATQLDLKLGAELKNCFTFIKNNSDTTKTLQESIIDKSDLISCNVLISGRPQNGPESSFKSIARNQLTFRKVIKSFNPNVEIIANFEWSSSGLHAWETKRNLRLYWETASKWALQEKYPVYMNEAFDNPWDKNPPSDSFLGWWELTNNSQINSVEGYQEKCLDEPARANENNDRNVATSGSRQRDPFRVAACGFILLTIFSY